MGKYCLESRNRKAETAWRVGTERQELPGVGVGTEIQNAAWRVEQKG